MKLECELYIKCCNFYLIMGTPEILALNLACRDYYVKYYCPFLPRNPMSDLCFIGFLDEGDILFNWIVNRTCKALKNTTTLFWVTHQRKSTYVRLSKMRHFYLDFPRNRSSSLTEKSEINTSSHFRWQSIKKYLYLAHAFSLNSFSFDLFSKVLVFHAHLFEYILYALTIGISYMFMDLFIKQYTKKLDARSSMNPLLRGVSFGILLQTALASLVHASNLADSVRFLFISMNRSPSWTKCQNIPPNMTCLSSENIIINCPNGITIDVKNTSAHLNYMKLFSIVDRNSLSMRFFVIAIVWSCNFFISSLTDNVLLKLFKLSFLWGVFSTTFILIFLMFSTQYMTQAFYEIMKFNNGFNHFNLVTDPFGVGLIGVYDFGTISSFTMVDNAVIIFGMVFIATAFARSLIVRVLYLKLAKCVEVKITETPHYLLFTVLPLSTEFMDAHKIFVLYIYLYLMTALVACLAMFTSTMSRILHSEFCSVKIIYIVGLLCFLGFTLTMPLTLCTFDSFPGLLHGLNICTLYLGAFKVAIVMWVYGVRRFSTDIHFWLGFEPTLFWQYSWMTLPFFILLIFFQKFMDIINLEQWRQTYIAFGWSLFTLIIVFIFMAKAIAKCIVQNNLSGLLKSSYKYGPPEVEDRKKRRCFDKVAQSRKCKHDCLILDEIFECNHLPLIFRSDLNVSNETRVGSLTNIYNAGPADETKRPSSVIDITNLHLA